MTPSEIAFARYVVPARRRPQIWRLLLGIVVSLVVYAGWVALVVWVTVTLRPGDTMATMSEIAAAEAPWAVLVLLATFLGLAIGPLVAARLLHGRGPRSVAGRGVRRDFVRAMPVLVLIYAAYFALALSVTEVRPNLDPGTWLMLLPLGLVGLLVQTGAEELFFRGYLQQQLAARFRSPLVWMLVPTVLFGLAHYDPVTAGENALYIVAGTATFGLVAADLTARTGSIGLAWAFHFLNNCAAILFVGTEGTITGLALFLTEHSVSDPEVGRASIVADLAFLFVTWAILRLVLRRRAAT